MREKDVFPAGWNGHGIDGMQRSVCALFIGCRLVDKPDRFRLCPVADTSVGEGPGHYDILSVCESFVQLRPDEVIFDSRCRGGRLRECGCRTTRRRHLFIRAIQTSIDLGVHIVS